VPWFDGRHAADVPVPDRTAWAGALAGALAALHVPAPADAPVNPVRGGALTGRTAALTARVEAGHLDAVLPGAGRRALALWDDALAAPAWPGPPVWLHGDPHPANLVVHAGALAALIDFGDVTAGDPACDLATAWLTFDAAGRAAFRARADALADAAGPPDPGRWRRAAGWALVMASALVTHSDDEPALAAIGAHALRDVLG